MFSNGATVSANSPEGVKSVDDLKKHPELVSSASTKFIKYFEDLLEKIPCDEMHQLAVCDPTRSSPFASRFSYPVVSLTFCLANFSFGLSLLSRGSAGLLPDHFLFSGGTRANVVSRLQAIIKSIIAALDPRIVAIPCGSYRREKDFSGVCMWCCP